MTRGTKIALGILGALAGAAVIGLVARSVPKRRFLASLPAEGKPYGEIIWDAAKRWKVSPTLLAAIIAHESGFGIYLTPKGPRGTSASGDDLGLAQISRKAHPEWVATHDWGDPATNIDKGAQVLASTLEAFPTNLAAAIAAYNAGPTNVRKALNAGKSPGDVTTHDSKGRDYVTNVAAKIDQLQARA